MIFKRNTAASLPVILIDDTDFKSAETAVSASAVTAKCAKEGAASLSTVAWTAGTPEWSELGGGIYLLTVPSGTMDTNGKLIYVVTVAGILPYFGLVEVRDNTSDVLGTELARVTAKLPGNTLSDFYPSASTPVYLSTAAQAELGAIFAKLPPGTLSDFYPSASTPVYLTVITEAELAAIKADTAAVAAKLPVSTISNFYPTASTPVYLLVATEAEFAAIKADTAAIAAKLPPGTLSDFFSSASTPVYLSPAVQAELDAIYGKLPVGTLSDFYATASTPVWLEPIVKAEIDDILARTNLIPAAPASEVTSQDILAIVTGIAATPIDPVDIASIEAMMHQVVDKLPLGTISDFFSSASTPVYLSPAVQAELDAIYGKLPAGTIAGETEAGINYANIIDEVDDVIDNLDVYAPAILADTGAIRAKLPRGTISDFYATSSTPVWLEPIVEGKIDDIKLQTDLLPATPADEVTSQAILVRAMYIPATPADQLDFDALEASIHQVINKLPVGTISDFYPSASTPVYLDAVIEAQIALIEALNARVPAAPANEVTSEAIKSLVKYLKSKKRYNIAAVAVPARHVLVGMLESIDTFIDATHYLHEELTYNTNGAVVSTSFVEV